MSLEKLRASANDICRATKRKRKPMKDAVFRRSNVKSIRVKQNDTMVDIGSVSYTHLTLPTIYSV